MLSAAYPWIKSLHIIAVVAWMAGLLYLPRLFVYHAEAPPGSNRAAMLMVMERRLLRGIMLPAIVMTYIFGIALALTPGVVDWGQAWIWLKLGFALVLTVFHLLLARWRQVFAEGDIPHTSRFFRIVNELPTVALIAIVLLVVAKPF